MSIEFDASALEGAYLSSGNISTPTTISLWFRPTTVSVLSYMAFWGKSGVSNQHWAIGIDSTDHLRFLARQTTSRIAATTSTVSVNTWHHGLAVERGNTDREVWLDNGTSGTNAQTANGATDDTFGVGRLFDSSSPYEPFDGQMDHVALWSNYEPTADERAALAAGVHPMLVHPEGLTYCLTNVGDTVIDVVTGTVLSTNPTGSTSTPVGSSESPVGLWPANPRIILPAGAAPASSAPTSTIYGALVGPMGGPI